MVGEGVYNRVTRVSTYSVVEIGDSTILDIACDLQMSTYLTSSVGKNVEIEILHVLIDGSDSNGAKNKNMDFGESIMNTIFNGIWNRVMNGKPTKGTLKSITVDGKTHKSQSFGYL